MLAEVVAATLEVHRESGGAFDLTVAPLPPPLRSRPGGDPSAFEPTSAAVAAARARTGSDRLRLTPGPVVSPLPAPAEGARRTAGSTPNGGTGWRGGVTIRSARAEGGRTAPEPTGAPDDPCRTPRLP